jgi:flagellar protein FlaG
MVSQVASVTAAPARTPAPTVQEADAAGKARVPAGNSSSAPGQTLPLEEAAPSAGDVENAVRRLTELVSQTQRSLRFRVDEASGRTIITVLDAETNEIVRQIPPPELLALARHLARAGTLLDAHG